MKSLPIALILALAATSFAQTPAPATPPIPAPSTIPAPTVEAYLQQLRTRYHVPDNVGSYATGGGRAGRMGGGMPGGIVSPEIQNLLTIVEMASRRGIPLDTIENVGDARARFLNDAQAASQKLREAVADLDSPAVQAKTAALKDQKDKVQIQFEVQQIKEKSIQDRIAQLTQQIAQKTESDDILQSLQKLEGLRQKELDRMRAMANVATATPATVEEAEAGLAVAHIQTAKRRAEIAATAFGGALDTLNKLLIQVSLDIEEQYAAIQAIDRRLNDLKRTDETLQKIRTLDSQIQVLKELQTVEQAMPLTTQP